MSDHATVLFANEAFYLAFLNGEMEAMDDVWAALAPVSCVHPGWNPLSGREAVMRSWRAILGATGRPSISCRNATAHVAGEMAYVLCHEVLDQGFLVATNIFLREEGAWKMVHHQAGAAPPPRVEEETEIPATLQ